MTHPQLIVVIPARCSEHAGRDLVWPWLELEVLPRGLEVQVLLLTKFTRKCQPYDESFMNFPLYLVKVVPLLILNHPVI